MKDFAKNLSRQEIVFVLIIVLLLLAAGWYALRVNADDKKQMEAIGSFEDCVAAGNPVMESYPEQCSANGKTFTNLNQNPQTEEQNELVISEWDIKMIPPPDNGEVSYRYESIDNSSNIIWFDFAKVFAVSDSATKSCAENAWGVMRYEKGSLSNFEGEENVKIEDTYAAKNGLLKQVNNGFYEEKYPQDGCIGDDEDINKVVRDASASSKALFTSIKAAD